MSFPYFDPPKDEWMDDPECKRTRFLTEDCPVRDAALSDLAESRKKWAVDWEGNMRHMIEQETQTKEIEELMAGMMNLSGDKEDNPDEWSILSNASKSCYDYDSTDSDSTESQDVSDDGSESDF